MQEKSEEYIKTVLGLLRQNKKIVEIAELTNRHRNTVGRYVRYIRENLVRPPQEIVNKIDDKLQEELENMTNYELIAYRKAITPQKIESKSETKIVHTREKLDIREWTEDERNYIQRIANKIKSSRNPSAK